MLGVITRSHVAKCSRCRSLRGRSCGGMAGCLSLPSRNRRNSAAQHKKETAVAESVNHHKSEHFEKELKHDRHRNGQKSSLDEDDLQHSLRLSADEKITRTKRQKMIHSGKVDHGAVNKKSRKIDYHVSNHCMSQRDQDHGVSMLRNGHHPNVIGERRITRATKCLLKEVTGGGNITSQFTHTLPAEDLAGQDSKDNKCTAVTDSDNSRFSTYNHILQRKRKRMSADICNGTVPEVDINSNKVINDASIQKGRVLNNLAKDDEEFHSMSEALDSIPNGKKLDSAVLPKSRVTQKTSKGEALKDGQFHRKVSSKKCKKETNKSLNVLQGVESMRKNLRKKSYVAQKQESQKQLKSSAKMVCISKGLSLRDARRETSDPVRVTRSKYRSLEGMVHLGPMNTQGDAVDCSNNVVNHEDHIHVPSAPMRVTRSMYKSLESRANVTENKINKSTGNLSKTKLKGRVLKRTRRNAEIDFTITDVDNHPEADKCLARNEYPPDDEKCAKKSLGKRFVSRRNDYTRGKLDSLPCIRETNSGQADSNIVTKQERGFTDSERKKSHRNLYIKEENGKLLDKSNCLPRMKDLLVNADSDEDLIKCESNASAQKRKDDSASTNVKDPAGRQMRPRPLDPFQPLPIFIEGQDKAFHEFDEHSFPWQPSPKNQMNSADFPVNNAASTVPGDTSTTEHLKKLEIKLPSYRTVSDYEEVMKHRNQSQSFYNLPVAYIRCSSLTSEINRYGFEYDIEDDDRKWLLNYNKSQAKRGIKLQLPESKFEELIEYFEEKSSHIAGQIDGLSLQKPPSKNSNPEKLHIDASIAKAEIGTSNSVLLLDKSSCLPLNFPISSDCCICNGGENSVSNPVYRCKSCGIFVHRSCYGIHDKLYGPEAIRSQTANWLCRKCEAFDTATHVCCAICCKTGGALKPTTEHGKWAHIVCALYTNETFFLDTDSMEPVDGISVVEARSRRQKFLCCFCGARVGSCARCSYHGCRTTFHISCGVSRGAFFEMQHSNEQVIHIKSFCPRHAILLMGGSAQLDFEQSKVLVSCSETWGNSNTQYNAGSALPVEKVSKDPPPDKKNEVVSLEAVLKADLGPDSVVKEVYAYWFNKHLKSGPLLLKLKQEEAVKKYGIFNKDLDGIKRYFGRKQDVILIPDIETMNKLASLRKELESVCLIAKRIIQREKIKAEIVSLFQRTSELKLFSLQKEYGLMQCFECNSSERTLYCDICGKIFCFPCYRQWERQAVKSYRIMSCRKCVCIDCERAANGKRTSKVFISKSEGC